LRHSVCKVLFLENSKVLKLFRCGVEVGKYLRCLFVTCLQQQQRLSCTMLITATEQLAAEVKETSGKERDEDDQDDEDEDDDNDNDDDDDVSDEMSQPHQPDVNTGQWSPVLYAGLPDWLRDNELIETGHRPQLNNFFTCLMSVFRVHSETGNIWTHLIGQQLQHRHHHFFDRIAVLRT